MQNTHVDVRLTDLRIHKAYKDAGDKMDIPGMIILSYLRGLREVNPEVEGLLPLPADDIPALAELAGLTRETFIKKMHQLHRRGLIELKCRKGSSQVYAENKVPLPEGPTRFIRMSLHPTKPEAPKKPDDEAPQKKYDIYDNQLADYRREMVRLSLLGRDLMVYKVINTISAVLPAAGAAAVAQQKHKKKENVRYQAATIDSIRDWLPLSRATVTASLDELKKKHLLRVTSIRTSNKHYVHLYTIAPASDFRGYKKEMKNLCRICELEVRLRENQYPETFDGYGKAAIDWLVHALAVKMTDGEMKSDEKDEAIYGILYYKDEISNYNPESTTQIEEITVSPFPRFWEVNANGKNPYGLTAAGLFWLLTHRCEDNYFICNSSRNTSDESCRDGRTYPDYQHPQPIKRTLFSMLPAKIKREVRDCISMADMKYYGEALPITLASSYKRYMSMNDDELEQALDEYNTIGKACLQNAIQPLFDQAERYCQEHHLDGDAKTYLYQRLAESMKGIDLTFRQFVIRQDDVLPADFKPEERPKFWDAGYPQKNTIPEVGLMWIYQHCLYSHSVSFSYTINYYYNMSETELCGYWESLLLS